MGIKIGNIDASYFKVGNSDCSIYLGDTKLYPTEEPTFTGKFKAWYNDGTTYTAACDSSSALTTATTRAHTTNKSGMTEAYIGDCVNTISINAFYNCSSLTNVNISSSVTTFGDYCFQNCRNLSSITFSDNVSSIGYSAFERCIGLTKIEIPDNVVYMDGSVFRNCSGLTSITIGSGISEMGIWCFQNCSSLTSVTITATQPPTLGVAAFSNTNDCPIYVPAESVNDYKAASNWSDGDVKVRIRPIPTLQWVSYYEGDSVPNYGVYGIKFQSSASHEYVEDASYIEFYDENLNYIRIYYSNVWYIETASGAEEITFDEETDYATIIFDDYGVGAATIDEMALLSVGMPFDMELYELN